MRPYLFFPGLFLICLVLHLFGDENVLQFNRQAIFHGEWWRLITGHLVHDGWEHFILDMGGLFVVWALVGKEYSNGLWFVVFMIGVLGISVGIFFLDPHIETYVGISGVLQTFFIAGAIRKIQKQKMEGLIYLFLILAKLAWEFFKGPLTLLPGHPIGLQAHYYGALAGIGSTMGIIVANMRIRTLV